MLVATPKEKRKEGVISPLSRAYDVRENFDLGEDAESVDGAVRVSSLRVLAVFRRNT